MQLVSLNVMLGSKHPHMCPSPFLLIFFRPFSVGIPFITPS